MNADGSVLEQGEWLRQDLRADVRFNTGREGRGRA